MKKDLETLVREILKQRKVKSQIGLAKILAEKGLKVDQSTLSRHLTKLGIRKVAGVYHLPEKETPGMKIIAVPPNLILIKSAPGQAQGQGIRIDTHPIEGLVGTLAGDDTVLCIVAGSSYLKRVKLALSELFEDVTL
ncbi:MAG: hypothetical protein HYX67_13925 [Candidatus Melainabacteria bacterium]|nr:hypothetical protein [Candidatus Melainabacteria bacterium]